MYIRAFVRALINKPTYCSHIRQHDSSWNFFFTLRRDLYAYCALVYIPRVRVVPARLLNIRRLYRKHIYIYIHPRKETQLASAEKIERDKKESWEREGGGGWGAEKKCGSAWECMRARKRERKESRPGEPAEPEWLLVLAEFTGAPAYNRTLARLYTLSLILLQKCAWNG